MAYKDIDVVIIGSGASGGMAAWNLVRKGAKVLLLEAGEKFDRNEFWSHIKPWEERERGKYGESPPNWFGTPLPDSPYQTPEDKPFWLGRVWALGGKTNIWGRVSLRYSDLNFQEPSRDGWETAWPVTYDELSPYYDNVERKIGVCGGDDHTPWLPGSKNYLPPVNLRCGEQLLSKAAAKVKYPAVHIRRANLTQGHSGRAPCHYCGACGRGCDIGAFFNSYDHLLADALGTGNLEPLGTAIHEHGTCRMGDDPKRSALNRFNQMHEVPNVVVVDGSASPTATEKNPTLTILALAWRASDYLAEQIKRAEI